VIAGAGPPFWALGIGRWALEKRWWTCADNVAHNGTIYAAGSTLQTISSPSPITMLSTSTRRQFLQTTAGGLFGAAVGSRLWSPQRTLFAQAPGERPERAANATVLNPRCRVPVGFIIDDSTCLVNLNRFAMPQFDAAWEGKKEVYHRNWRDWPAEIPDEFVRRFAEWASENGVKGKYSIVPFPACVGRLDREMPGWSQRDLAASIALVQRHILPNWDLHPEMITHTRVIDIKTGHPYPERSPAFMENWDWTAGKSVDELSSYMAYALNILKTVDLPCSGMTTPGGFGRNARDSLAGAALQSQRDVFKTEIPHYFRDVEASGPKSVAPRVELAKGLDGPNPECVVSVVGCTGDWTGGWDCVDPPGADPFIDADLRTGRMVEVIAREEPALMLAHWTGVYFNGYELGFKVFQEIVKRLHKRFDNLVWMKLSEVARYWATKELTRVAANGSNWRVFAPFACPDFTLRVPRIPQNHPPVIQAGEKLIKLEAVSKPLELKAGSYCQQDDAWIVCWNLERGENAVLLSANM